MLNIVDLRANIAVMKILVELLIQDYLHIPCKKTIALIGCDVIDSCVRIT